MEASLKSMALELVPNVLGTRTTTTNIQRTKRQVFKKKKRWWFFFFLNTTMYQAHIVNRYGDHDALG